MPAAPAPYDIVTVVLNAAKMRLNDNITSLAALGGQILKNTQAFSQTAVNTAWRKLQDGLADLGYTRLKRETTFVNVPACAVPTDPAVQVSIGWTGYWDGSVLQAAPYLPQDFIAPLDVWERQAASLAVMTETDRILNGLPAAPHAQWNRQWEWRDDALYLPGATVATDIKLRYAAFLLDFVDVAASPGANQIANTAWYGQPVPILRCGDSLAAYICAEFCTARGDTDGALMFLAEAKAKAQLILNRDTAQPKAILKASEFGKMRDRFTPSDQSANTEPIKR